MEDRTVLPFSFVEQIKKKQKPLIVSENKLIALRLERKLNISVENVEGVHNVMMMNRKSEAPSAGKQAPPKHQLYVLAWSSRSSSLQIFTLRRTPKRSFLNSVVETKL